MLFRGWFMLIFGAILLTVIFGGGLYYHEIFFSICISLSLILTTDKVRMSYQRSRQKVFSERKILYGFALMLLWICAGALLVLSVQQLSEITTIIDETGVESIDSFVTKVKARLPANIGAKVFSAGNIAWAQNYLATWMRKLATESEFMIYYVPFILPLIVGLYLLRGPIVNFGLFFLPSKTHEAFVEVARDTRKRLYDFISAKLLESVVVGFICAIGFGIVQLKGWFILGMLVGALNIVPYVGPIIGAIPPLALTLLLGDVQQGIVVALTLFFAQVLDNVYLQPIMIADKVSIHPLVAIGVALIGSHFWGAMGLFFSIPVWIAYEGLVVGWYDELQLIYPDGSELPLSDDDYYVGGD